MQELIIPEIVYETPKPSPTYLIGIYIFSIIIMCILVFGTFIFTPNVLFCIGVALAFCAAVTSKERLSELGF